MARVVYWKILHTSDTTLTLHTLAGNVKFPVTKLKKTSPALKYCLLSWDSSMDEIRLSSMGKSEVRCLAPYKATYSVSQHLNPPR